MPWEMECVLHLVWFMNAGSSSQSPLQLRLTELLEHAHEAFDARGQTWKSGDRSSLHDIESMTAAYLEMGRIQVAEPEPEVDLVLPSAVPTVLAPVPESTRDPRGLKVAVGALVAVAVLGSVAVATAAYLRFRPAATPEVAAAPEPPAVAVSPAPVVAAAGPVRPGVEASLPAAIADDEAVPTVIIPVTRSPETRAVAAASEPVAAPAPAPLAAAVRAPIEEPEVAPAPVEESGPVEPAAVEEPGAIEPAAGEPAAGEDQSELDAELAADPCGDVACLLEPGKACCQPQAAPQPEEVAALPERPHRAEVDAQMRRVIGPVETCADRNGVAGTVVVRLVIRPDGQVDSAWPDLGTRAFGDCVQAAVRNTRYSASREGMTVSYPFVIR
jgi:hypothetical protein